MHKMKNINFPAFVIKVLEELSDEKETQSIWFIGSRANDRERLESDWDFIVFVSDEITERNTRNQNVDIIRVYQNRDYLLEGQNISMCNPFENWQWIESEPGLASYTVREIPNVRAGEASDIEDDKYIQLQGINVWQRNA